MDKKCLICRKDPDPNCTWNQGRCPHRKPMIEKPFPTWLLVLTAPFIIIGWMLVNPRKVWEEAKKAWNL